MQVDHLVREQVRALVAGSKTAVIRIALAAAPEVVRWSGKSLSSGQFAAAYGFTDLDDSQPDAWRYLGYCRGGGALPSTT